MPIDERSPSFAAIIGIPAVISPDGQTVLLGNVYKKNGEVSGGVSISQRISDKKWTFPKEVQIDNYYTLFEVHLKK